MKRLNITESNLVGGPIILWQDYDIRQAWLPFVVAVLGTIQPETKKTEAFNQISTKKILDKASRNEKMIHPEGDDLRLYTFTKDVHQMLLPFGQKILTTSESIAASLAGFPGWERYEDGRLATIPIHRRDKNRLREWQNNLDGHCAFISKTVPSTPNAANELKNPLLAVFSHIHDQTMARVILL